MRHLYSGSVYYDDNHLNGSQIAAEETNGNITVYIYDYEGLPLGMQYHGASYAEDEWDVYWYEKNIFGDIVAVYNEAGTKLISYTYDAWGNFTASYYNGGRNSTAYNNPFRYRGYYYDTDLALYYLNARYYDSTIGRWISPEPNMYAFAFDSGSGLNGYNVYAYCANNPVMFVDPTGEAVLTSILIGAAVGAAIGIVIGGTIGGTIAYNSAKSSGAEGSDLFWATAGGVGKGALIGGIGGGLLGAAGGAIAAGGFFTTAATTTLSTVANVAAKSAEVSILQIKKSIGDGDNGWQIANDCMNSIFRNGKMIASPAASNTLKQYGTYCFKYKFNSIKMNNSLISYSYGGALMSCLFVANNWSYTLYSMSCNDPIVRANQRGYCLE